MTTDTLTIYAYDWRVQESYGRIASELAGHLEAMGVYVNRIGPYAPKPHPIRMSLGGIALGYPTQIRNYGNLLTAGPVIWLTMFEATELPFLWSDILNTLDAVITPSDGQPDIFKASGVEAPVHVAHLGVSEAFKPVRRDPERPFTFLVIADRGERKGWIEAGQALVRAFGDDNPNVKMILKARKDAFPFAIANGNMEVIQQDMTDCELLDLYARCDAMIFPGREAFGLPPREFAATGGTSIVLNWGGTADHLSRWGLPIASAGMTTAFPHSQKLRGCGEWPIIDVDDLAATLRHVVAHRGYYAERGQQAAAFVRQQYRWSTFAEQVYAIWQEACNGKRTLRDAV